MAREYYDLPIGPDTDWGGDASTGGKQVKGNRVQEYIKGEIADLHSADEQIKGSIADVIETAAADHERAEEDHATSQEWNDHPPFIGDGRTGEKNYWYVWVNHEYVKSAYAKGNDLHWDEMTQQDVDMLIDSIAEHIALASENDVRDIVENFEP